MKKVDKLDCKVRTEMLWVNWWKEKKTEEMWKGERLYAGMK